MIAFQEQEAYNKNIIDIIDILYTYSSVVLIVIFN